MSLFTQVHNLINGVTYRASRFLQRLADAGAYNQEAASNKLDLDISVHNGFDFAHSAYNDFVQQGVRRIEALTGDLQKELVNSGMPEADAQAAANQAASQTLEGFKDYLRDQAGTNLPLNRNAPNFTTNEVCGVIYPLCEDFSHLRVRYR
jgi:hypothetical protein